MEPAGEAALAWVSPWGTYSTWPGRLNKPTIAALQAENKRLRDCAVWQLSQDSSRMD